MSSKHNLEYPELLERGDYRAGRRQWNPGTLNFSSVGHENHYGESLVL